MLHFQLHATLRCVARELDIEHVVAYRLSYGRVLQLLRRLEKSGRISRVGYSYRPTELGDADLAAGAAVKRRTTRADLLSQARVDAMSIEDLYVPTKRDIDSW
jgi:hypothetical protein